jgi:hypothetical protein
VAEAWYASPCSNRAKDQYCCNSARKNIDSTLTGVNLHNVVQAFMKISMGQLLLNKANKINMT